MPSSPSSPDHAAPYSVIKVQHHAFRRAPLPGRDQAGDKVAVKSGGDRRDFLLGAVPQHRVMPETDAIGRGPAVQGQQIDAVRVRRVTQGLVSVSRAGQAGRRSPAGDVRSAPARPEKSATPSVA